MDLYLFTMNIHIKSNILSEWASNGESWFNIIRNVNPMENVRKMGLLGVSHRSRTFTKRIK